MDPSSPDYLLQNLTNVYTDPDPRTYPLSSYVYMIEPTGVYPSPETKITTGKRQAIADFEYYSICQGQKEIGPIGYSPLPVNLVEAGFGQIQKLQQADPGIDLTNLNITTCDNPTFIEGQPNTQLPGHHRPLSAGLRPHRRRAVWRRGRRGHPGDPRRRPVSLPGDDDRPRRDRRCDNLGARLDDDDNPGEQTVHRARPAPAPPAGRRPRGQARRRQRRQRRQGARRAPARLVTVPAPSTRRRSSPSSSRPRWPGPARHRSGCRWWWCSCSWCSACRWSSATAGPACDESPSSETAPRTRRQLRGGHHGPDPAVRGRLHRVGIGRVGLRRRPGGRPGHPDRDHHPGQRGERAERRGRHPDGDPQRRPDHQPPGPTGDRRVVVGRPPDRGHRGRPELLRGRPGGVPLRAARVPGGDSTTVPAAQQISPETCWTQTWSEHYQDSLGDEYPPYRLDEYDTAGRDGGRLRRAVAAALDVPVRRVGTGPALGALRGGRRPRPRPVRCTTGATPAAPGSPPSPWTSTAERACPATRRSG